MPADHQKVAEYQPLAFYQVGLISTTQISSPHVHKGPPMPETRPDELNLLFDSDRWFRLPFCFIRGLGISEGILLAYLLNQHAKFALNPKKYEKYKGWYYCQRDRLERDLYIKPRQQANLLAGLKKKGLIDTKQAGNPVRRFVLIKFKKVLKLLQSNLPKNNDGKTQ
jgi:hypothetical protein